MNKEPIDKVMKALANKLVKQHGRARTIILSRLSDLQKMELLKENVDEYDDYYKSEIIETIKDPKLKIQALKEVSSNSVKVEIIRTIDDPKLKIEALKELTSDSSKVEIIKTIDDSELKIEALEEVEDDYYKVQCIKSIENSVQRLEIALRLFHEYDVEKYFGNDLDVETIRNIGDIKHKTKAIRCMDDDSKKVEAIRTIKEQSERLEVALQVLYDDNLKAEFIKEIENPEERLEVALQVLYEDNLKAEFIKEIENPEERLKVALRVLRNSRTIVEVIKNIEDIDVRIDALKEIQDNSIKVEIIKTIENPEKRLEAALEWLDKDELKLEFINEVQDTNLKIELLKRIQDKRVRLEIIKTIVNLEERLAIEQASTSKEYDEFLGNLVDTKYISAIKEPRLRLEVALILLDDFQKIDFIKEIENPEERLEVALRELHADYLKVEFIKEIENPEERLEVALRELQDDYRKAAFIKEIENPKERVEIAVRELTEEWTKWLIIDGIEESKRIELLKECEGEAWLQIAESLEDETKLKVLDDADEEQRLNLTRTIRNPEVALKAIDKLELEDKQKECLKRMFQKNNSILKNIDIRLLDEHYINTLGEDKANLISCYPEIQEQVLMLGEKEYAIFLKVIDNYVKNNETDEWTVIAALVLENLGNGQYSELIENIEDLEDVNIERLSKIMQFPNDFGIKTMEDIENFEQIKRQKCDEIIASSESSLEDKKNAVLLKLFGQDITYVQDIIKKFGQDIENIDDGEEKYYIETLKLIMELDDESVLTKIYNECEEVSLIDTTSMIRQLKTVYGKKFNEGLYQPKEEDLVEEDKLPDELKELGVRVYDAGTDFRMMITSVAAFVKNQPEDFCKDWNRPSIGSQQFCASYIRNDMMGTAPIPHACYGFGQMKEDSLMLSGPANLRSSATKHTMVVIARATKNEVYYSPNEQINKTGRFNEMCFRRTQGGEKKQPDYIIAFKRKGVIDNIEKIIKASQDWGGKLPIVIIDVDECLRAEMAKVSEMLKEYEISKDPEKAREIIQKVRNNRVTDSEFGIEIEEQLEQMRKELEEQEIGQEDLRQNYDSVSAEERREGISEIKEMLDRMHEITTQKEGEDIGR